MNTFLISDTHFTHHNALKFTRDDGKLLRPFATVEEMDETIITNWNSVIRPNDRVYHLGDVVMNKKALHLLHRLNGDKRLILGNHDTAPLGEYYQYFKRVSPYWNFDDCLFSHIPVHPSNIGRWKMNIHGHTHSNYVMDDKNRDSRYVNVSVDCDDMNFFPKSWEEIKLTFNRF